MTVSGRRRADQHAAPRSAIKIGSTGTVTVTGAGSRWDLIQPVFAFHVGSSGTGTLNVLAGGRVTSTVFGMDLGVDLGAVGNVLVSGANSAADRAEPTNIGSAAGGTGTMQASDNGLLALGTVTVGASGQGTLTVDTAADLPPRNSPSARARRVKRRSTAQGPPPP